MSARHLTTEPLAPPPRTVLDRLLRRKPSPRGIPGPCGKAWRESVLARAIEIQGLTEAFTVAVPLDSQEAALKAQIHDHLTAVRQAAVGEGLGRWGRFRPTQWGASVERATSNLDNAEVALLRLAPARYVLGQQSSLYAQVRAHLREEDPQRIAMAALVDQLTPGRVTGRLRERGRLSRARSARGGKRSESDATPGLGAVDRETIIAAFQSAAREARREVARVKSFRNILYMAALVLSGLVLLLTVLAYREAQLLPLCFTPVETAVCPTHTGLDDDETSAAAAATPTPTTPETSDQTPNSAMTNGQEARQAEALDRLMRDTADKWDVVLVELVGALAAALSAAVALRGMRGTATPYSLPTALAVLKIPTGALSAVLGILLLRGEFIPGLSALDTSGQIIAWAIVFGAAQQLVTRMLDEKARGVLAEVSTPGTEKAPDVQGRDV
jgi:hypothetical protein